MLASNTNHIFCLIIALTGQLVSSVILPPGPIVKAQFHQIDDYPTKDRIKEDVPPYKLTFIDGESLEVSVDSSSSVTINMNKPVEHEIQVSLSVFSGPNLINLKEDKIIFETDTCGDKVVDFKTGSNPGHAEIVAKVITKLNDTIIDDSSAYISININRNPQLNILISVVGWFYFFAWSLSFYFQAILNFQRKSVVGLNFDFLALNLMGFTCYSIYNFALKFSREVQQDYYQRYTYSRIPVEYNDLFFAVHAIVLTIITAAQCFIYERGQQTVSIPASAFIGLTSLLGLGLYITHLFNQMSILNVVLYLSYVKLCITIIKYVPQAYMNYQRKATSGWSIHNILLDFTGGILSIGQMFLLGYNYNDWVSIFGNFTKFGLGLVSILFDIIFVTQHYILYKRSDSNLDDSNDSHIPSPVIHESIRSSTYIPYSPGSYNPRSEEEDEEDQDPNQTS